jgi:phosphonate C-P lyase system protein PhnL
VQYTCSNIKKNYSIYRGKKIEVLKGVSIELNDMDFIALQGASGAGKSTLLHAIGGLEKPDEGQMIFQHGDTVLELNKLSDQQMSGFRNKHIGFVFQFHHLLPEFTAIENVMIPAMIAGDTKQVAQSKAVKLIDRIGMSERISHKPDELSGGEQQRITIARALINSPSMLLADEPTGNLDEQNSKIIIDLIDELRQDYKLICLIATHSPAVAARAEKIITLHDGMII